jgi:hypothetical protein
MWLREAGGKDHVKFHVNFEDWNKGSFELHDTYYWWVYRNIENIDSYYLLNNNSIVLYKPSEKFTSKVVLPGGGGAAPTLQNLLKILGRKLVQMILEKGKLSVFSVWCQLQTNFLESQLRNNEII